MVFLFVFWFSLQFWHLTSGTGFPWCYHTRRVEQLLWLTIIIAVSCRHCGYTFAYSFIFVSKYPSVFNPSTKKPHLIQGNCTLSDMMPRTVRFCSL